MFTYYLRSLASAKGKGHGIPTEEWKPKCMRRDYDGILNEIILMLSVTRYGFLFCFWKEFNAVQGALRFLKSRSSAGTVKERNV